MGFPAKDLTGQKFGRWFVLSRATIPAHIKSKRPFWNCKCDCGAEGVIDGSDLRKGHSKSCGCYRDELAKVQSIKHGHTANGNIPPEYNAWSSMLYRCTNPSAKNYKDYGGRGITVCDSWYKFENFYEDMGPRPENASDKRRWFSLERKDVNGPYCKENCVWATMKEQGRNKRCNVIVEKDGKRYTLSQIAELLGLSEASIHYRYERGWPVEDLFAPRGVRGWQGPKSRRST